jgi:hypothetical protein
MSAYLRIRRFVDRDLGDRFRPASIFIALIPLLIAGVVTRQLGQVASPGIWIVGTVISICWLAFVAWRGSRLFRAVGLRGDREFDQVTKFTLPPEYRDSESLTRAMRRKPRRP